MEPNVQAPTTFAPPIASPGSVPGIPRDNEVGLSQDEMRARLSEMLSQLSNKGAEMAIRSFSSTNNAKEQSGALMRELFDFFEEVGVDPSNPGEVSAYLDKLRQQNPELAQQLEVLMGRILSRFESFDQGAVDVGGGNMPQNMNIDPNAPLPQNI